MKPEELHYLYNVTFTSSQGPGQIQVARNCPIRDKADEDGIAADLERACRLTDVVVTGYRALR